eukprot:g3866.t1
MTYEQTDEEQENETLHELTAALRFELRSLTSNPVVLALQDIEANLNSIQEDTNVQRGTNNDGFTASIASVTSMRRKLGEIRDQMPSEAQVKESQKSDLKEAQGMFFRAEEHLLQLEEHCISLQTDLAVLALMFCCLNSLTEN